MKLEEGKWYKWYQKNHDSTHTGKYFNCPDEGFVEMKPWIVRSIQYNKEGTFDSKYMQDIVEITDLTEIQKLLPDCHEDKVIIFKSERYLATMKFFNELKEPERSQAIENYDENRYGIPSKLNNALTNGFDWGKSKQGYKYWNDIRDSIENNTYFKELEPEVLVFGKYKIGDIVVSLIDYSSDIKKGGLFIVTKESTKHLLIQSNDWRLATPEEAEAYNSGIRNIADIKPTSLEGRYIKCLKKNNWNDGKTKIGDILKIRKSDSVGDLFIGFECLDNSRLKNGEFELLPIDYNPDLIKEVAMPDKPTPYIAKIGDYVEVIDVSRNCFKLGQMVLCIDENHFKDTHGHGTVQFLSPISYRVIFNTTSNNPSGLITRDVSILNTFISKYDTFDMYGNKVYPLTPKEAYPNYSLPVPTNIILKTKSKSIKL